MRCSSRSRSAGSAAPICTWSWSVRQAGRHSRPRVVGHRGGGAERLGLVARRPGGGQPGDRGAACAVPAAGAAPRSACNRATADFVGYRGAFCQYKTVAADGLIRIPDSLPTRVGRARRADGHHAARTAAGRCRTRTIGCSSPGAGPVGLLLVAVLRAQGITDITVSEPSAVRRQQALAVGATRVVTPDTLEAATDDAARRRALRGGVRMLGPRQCGRGGLRPARLRGHPGHRGDRVRTTPDQPEPHDHLRARRSSGPTTTTTRASSRPWTSSAAAPCRSRRLIEPENIPLSEVMVSMERLARGEIPSKVMVQPSLPL